MTFRSLFLVAVLSSSVCSSGCSSLFEPKTPPAVRATVVSVSASYIGYVVTRNFRQLNSLVLWSNYLDKGKDGMKKSEFVHQVESLQGRWPSESHPLLGLGIEDVSVDEDIAVVRLQKPNTPGAEEIRINLYWNGTAWMVVDDSLFGEGHLIEKWTQVRARPS